MSRNTVSFTADERLSVAAAINVQYEALLASKSDTDTSTVSRLIDAELERLHAASVKLGG